MTLKREKTHSERMTHSEQGCGLSLSKWHTLNCLCYSTYIEFWPFWRYFLQRVAKESKWDDFWGGSCQDHTAMLKGKMASLQS